MKNAGKITPNKGKGPVQIVGELPEDANLAVAAKAVNAAKTPHKDQCPTGLSLALFAKLDKASAADALKALATVKGVDSKGSKADVKKGQISVKLKGVDSSGGAKLKIADILAALKKAGIEASISKT